MPIDKTKWTGDHQEVMIKFTLAPLTPYGLVQMIMDMLVIL